MPKNEFLWALFKPDDYWKVKQWKDHDFTPQEVQSWINAGLSKKSTEFAVYLRNENYQPNKTLNLKQLREKYNTLKWSGKLAQECLDKTHPKSKRSNIKRLDISNTEDSGLKCSLSPGLKVHCSADNRPEVKCQAIANCLANKGDRSEEKSFAPEQKLVWININNPPIQQQQVGQEANFNN